jgi:hypothetical protein
MHLGIPLRNSVSPADRENDIHEKPKAMQQMHFAEHHDNQQRRA